jgi:hypothetical protein
MRPGDRRGGSPWLAVLQRRQRIDGRRPDRRTDRRDQGCADQDQRHQQIGDGIGRRRGEEEPRDQPREPVGAGGAERDAGDDEPGALAQVMASATAAKRASSAVVTLGEDRRSLRS